MPDIRISLLLHNIRSAYNVGAILRTADGTGVKEVIYSGYTPSYNDLNLLPHLRQKLNHQIAKSSLGAELTIPQQETDDPVATILSYRNNGYLIVGLENNLSPEELPRRLILGHHSELYRAPIAGDPCVAAEGNFPAGPGPNSPQADEERATVPSDATPGQDPLCSAPPSLLLVLGEEVAGIPASLRPHLDFFLEIPMRGHKESFNVSVATAIALWALTSGATCPEA